MKINRIFTGIAAHAQTLSCPPTYRLPHQAFSWATLAALAWLMFELRPAQAQAGVTQAWVHRFSNVVSNSVDRASQIVRDAAGDIIVTGTSDDNVSGPDLLTIKYSGVDGSVIWQQRQRYFPSADEGNYPRGTFEVALAVDVNGNVVVTGSIVDSDNNAESDYYTAKYAAASGVLLWEKRHHRAGDDRPRAVAVDKDGNVVVTGSTATLKYAAADGALLWEIRSNAMVGNYDAAALAVDGNGNVLITGSANSDYYTAKYAATDGALLWEKRYNGPANREDQALAVAVDASGNVLVTGSSRNGEPFNDSDSYTAKYAATDGALLWEKRYRGPGIDSSDDQASAVVVDGVGNVIVTGSSDNDYYTAKYAAGDGALVWEKRTDIAETNRVDQAQAIALDSDGNVIVTGRSDYYSEASQAGYLVDYSTAKYGAADGTLLWEKHYNTRATFWGGLGGTSAAALAVDGGGNVFMIGSALSDDASRPPVNSDYYAAKYAARDGALLWETRYNGPVKYDASFNGIVVDAVGNVVVTGQAGFGAGEEFSTAKYAAGDGALLWEKRGGSLGQGRAVALDQNGNVIVTGSYNGHRYTAKYETTHGTLIWEERSNGTERDSAYGNAVAVDSSGNVVVAGGYYPNGSHSDYFTVKHSATDGTLLWERRYNGPANGDDQAIAVAVDSGGNVIVTGRSTNIGSTSGAFGYDYYTVKYAAADGARLWEQRYNGPANLDDQAWGLAVDGSGNVIVTGLSATSGSIRSGFVSDCYTAKYAAADGALLWEKRSPGGGQRVSLDGSGNLLVTGSGHTTKYSPSDGAILWDRASRASDHALDGSGNVIVMGTSFNPDGTGDFYTAKLASVDGSVLWKEHYNGPANRHEFAYAIAANSSSTVAVTGISFNGAGTDAATVVYRENLNAVSIERVPTGIVLRFTGVPGRGYTLEHAPAVIGPWSTINTQTTSTSGLLEYLDANPPAGTAFYRTREP